MLSGIHALNDEQGWPNKSIWGIALSKVDPSDILWNLTMFDRDSDIENNHSPYEYTCIITTVNYCDHYKAMNKIYLWK